MVARRSPSKKPVTTVAYVGAGPGDPGLLTLNGADLLATAEVVVADPTVSPAVLARAASAEVVIADSDAASVCIARARAGQNVVRLVAGTPLETPACVGEALALAKAKVAFQVVPGLSPLSAVPAYAGVGTGLPLTLADGSAIGETDWAGLAAAPGTLVVQSPPSQVGKLAAALLERGRPGETPVAVTTAGTTPTQRTFVTTLERLEADVDAAEGLDGSVVVTVGDGVRRHDKLSWWETRPLFGWTVLVPRTREQSGPLSDLLRGYGAQPLEVPTLAVEPPRTPAPMERAIKGLVSGRYQWVAFTSANAVKAVREKLEEYGLDARAFAGVRVAAVGDATGAALLAFGIRPDLLPSGQQSSEGLLADWPDWDEVLDPIDRVFLPRADIATETLVAGLKERGWAVDDITAYRTVRAAPPPAPIREALKGGGVDAVVFTSSSTVRNLVGIAGKPHERTVLAAIGPQTAQTARDLGLRVDVQAPDASVPSLAAALAQFATERRAAEAEAGPPPPAGRPSRPSRARKRTDS